MLRLRLKRLIETLFGSGLKTVAYHLLDLISLQISSVCDVVYDYSRIVHYLPQKSFCTTLQQNRVCFLSKTVINLFYYSVAVNFKCFHGIDRALFQVILLSRLWTILVEVIHIVPPFIWILAEYKKLSKLLFHEYLTNIWYPSVKYFFAKGSIVITITLLTVFAWNCCIIKRHFN